MSEQPRPYEPLTSENAALILIDHQVGLMTGVRDYSTGELKHNVVGLAPSGSRAKRDDGALDFIGGTNTHRAQLYPERR